MEYNTIYNENCLAGMKLLPDKSIDLIVTDPPYEMKTEGGNTKIGQQLKSVMADMKSGEVDFTCGYDIASFASEVERIMKNINIYFWCNKLQIPEYIDTYVQKLKCKFDIITWHKQNAIPMFSNKYLTDTEYCLYFRRGGYCKPDSYEMAKTYFVSALNKADKDLYSHPTIKPLTIIERLILNSSKEGEIVLDPFLGSGTTAVAAIKHKRQYIGYEIDHHYFDIASKRIADQQNTQTLF